MLGYCKVKEFNLNAFERGYIIKEFQVVEAQLVKQNLMGYYVSSKVCQLLVGELWSC